MISLFLLIQATEVERILPQKEVIEASLRSSDVTFMRNDHVTLPIDENEKAFNWKEAIVQLADLPVTVGLTTILGAYSSWPLGLLSLMVGSAQRLEGWNPYTSSQGKQGNFYQRLTKKMLTPFFYMACMMALNYITTIAYQYFMFSDGVNNEDHALVPYTHQMNSPLLAVCAMGQLSQVLSSAQAGLCYFLSLIPKVNAQTSSAPFLLNQTSKARLVASQMKATLTGHTDILDVTKQGMDNGKRKEVVNGRCQERQEIVYNPYFDYHEASLQVMGDLQNIMNNEEWENGHTAACIILMEALSQGGAHAFVAHCVESDLCSSLFLNQTVDACGYMHDQSDLIFKDFVLNAFYGELTPDVVEWCRVNDFYVQVFTVSKQLGEKPFAAFHHRNSGKALTKNLLDIFYPNRTKLPTNAPLTLPAPSTTANPTTMPTLAPTTVAPTPNPTTQEPSTSVPPTLVPSTPAPTIGDRCKDLVPVVNKTQVEWSTWFKWYCDYFSYCYRGCSNDGLSCQSANFLPFLSADLYSKIVNRLSIVLSNKTLEDEKRLCQAIEEFKVFNQDQIIPYTLPTVTLGTPDVKGNYPASVYVDRYQFLAALIAFHNITYGS